jgi:nucleotidyltransferase substrate binding protein (TIGR01987 family)
MALDLSSLQKAVGSLERAMRVADKLIEGKVDNDQEEVIRAGVIQNFEFTYDQSVKFIARWLEANVAGSDPDHKTFKDVLRMGVESQLIDNIDDWVEYRDARNDTSHAYDNDKAEDVFNVAKTFLKDARQLLKTLEMKND